MKRETRNSKLETRWPGFLLLASCFFLISCMQLETDRAAPSLHLVRQHRDLETRNSKLETRNDWVAARVREERAVTAYYDSIDKGDQKTFLAAKRELKEAAAAVQALLPAESDRGSQMPEAGGAGSKKQEARRGGTP